MSEVISVYEEEPPSLGSEGLNGVSQRIRFAASQITKIIAGYPFLDSPLPIDRTRVARNAAIISPSDVKRRTSLLEWELNNRSS